MLALVVRDGMNMRKYLVMAALLTMTTGLPACAEGEQSTTTGDFIGWYGNGESLLPRLYIKGVGEGISAYNALSKTEGGGFYCPPGQLGIVDAQYVLILKNYVAKMPNFKKLPVPPVLLYALRDTFPCN